MPLDKHYLKSHLKTRGWSDRLIKSLLGEPNDTRTNPHLRSGPPICLYLKTRVHRAEKRKAFKDSQVGRGQRQEAAARAVGTKKRKLREAFDAITVVVPVLGWATLTERAIAHYNGRLRWDRIKDDYLPTAASAHSDEWFLNRIRVNFLRHELTSYERILRGIAGRGGVDEAYGDVNSKALDAIADAYPDLADECNWQKETAELAAGYGKSPV
jgi:hypothetical protein